MVAKGEPEEGEEREKEARVDWGIARGRDRESDGMRKRKWN